VRGFPLENRSTNLEEYPQIATGQIGGLHPPYACLTVFRRCVAQGLYASEWLGNGDEPPERWAMRPLSTCSLDQPDPYWLVQQSVLQTSKVGPSVVLTVAWYFPACPQDGGASPPWLVCIALHFSAEYAVRKTLLVLFCILELNLS